MFQYPYHRSQPPMLSVNSICWSIAHCAKILSCYERFIRGKMKITESQVQADDGEWSNNSHRKRFRSLFVAAAVWGRALSWRRTIPEDNIPRHFSEIKESNYSTHSTFGRRHYCFRHVYVLKTDKYDVSQLMGILETLHNTSAQSLIWFSLWF